MVESKRTQQVRIDALARDLIYRIEDYKQLCNCNDIEVNTILNALKDFTDNVQFLED